MPIYTTEVPVWATLHIKAETPEAAAAILARIDCYDITVFGRFDPEEEAQLSETATLWTHPPDASFGTVLPVRLDEDWGEDEFAML